MNLRLLIIFFFFSSQTVSAQQVTHTDTAEHKTAAAKHKILKGLIAPAALIGVGLYTMQDNGIYSSFDASHDARQSFPAFSTNADDFVFLIPVVGLYAFDIFSSQNRHEVSRQTTLLFSSAALMGAMVWPLKSVSNIDRPDNSNDHSFPSGHTSSAFVVAGVIDQEFRGKSPWISVGAYTIAGSTGVLRMLNNKHWLSDVFAGAGFGLLSVHTVYYVHDRFLKSKNITLFPSSAYGTKGLTLLATF